MIIYNRVDKDSWMYKPAIDLGRITFGVYDENMGLERWHMTIEDIERIEYLKVLELSI